MRRTIRPLAVLVCLFTSVTMVGCRTTEAAAVNSQHIQQAVRPVSSSASESQPLPLGDRLPLENTQDRLAEIRNFRKIGAQFLLEDDRAYKLAAIIYSYRDYRNTLIFNSDFSSISEAPVSLLVEIAASQSPHIDIYGEAFEAADPQSQPVKRFFEEQSRAGRSVSLLSYGEDVRKMAKVLFGDSFELPAQDGISIRYSQPLDLYYLDAEGSTLATDYPVITSIESEPDGGLTARAVILSYWDSFNQWSFPDGSWGSQENADIQAVKEYVCRNIDRLPAHVYTFTPRTDGEWGISGFSKAA